MHVPVKMLDNNRPGRGNRQGRRAANLSMNAGATVRRKHIGRGQVKARHGLGLGAHVIRELGMSPAPVPHISQGAYAVVERPLNQPKDGVRKTTAFAKIGVSDGATTAFRGSWQAGVLVEHALNSRPDSSFSLGVSQGFLDQRCRDNGRDAGLSIGRSEMIVEATYADKVAPHLTLQPDVQWVHNPSGNRATHDAIVVGLRFGLAFGA